MASVYKRPGRKVWTAFYRDEAGKQHCRSTGSRTKKQAHRIAEEFERGAREKRTLRQLTRVLDQMHELVNGQKVTRLSLAELVSQWLAIKKLETSPAPSLFTGRVQTSSSVFWLSGLLVIPSPPSPKRIY